MNDAERRALRHIASGLDWAATAEHAWRPPPFHVEGLHRSAENLILDGIADAAASRDAGPLGVVVQGEGGSGKTHLLGWVRHRVERDGGYFFLVDFSAGGGFWEPTARAMVADLGRTTETTGDPQAVTLLRRLSDLAKLNEPATAAVTGVARCTAADLDALVGGLLPLDRRLVLDFADTLRALVLYMAPDLRASQIGHAYLTSAEETAEGDRAAYGLNRRARTPQDVVRDLSAILALTGPSVIAVDQIDSLLAHSAKTTGDAGTPEDPQDDVIEEVAGGLMALRHSTRRTLCVVACLGSSWRLVENRAVNTVKDRFRTALRLGTVGDAATARALVERRVAASLDGTGFTPPHPTWPVHPDAFATVTGYTPRALLKQVYDHVGRCRSADEIRLLDRFGDTDETAPTPAPTPAPRPAPVSASALAALDARFAGLRRGAETAAALTADTEDEAVPPLLAAGLAAWIREAGEAGRAFSIDPPPGRRPDLHARLRLLLDPVTDAQRHWTFRAIGATHHRAAHARLRTACVAAGVGTDIPDRTLVVLRNIEWSSGEKTRDLVRYLYDSGGRSLAVTADDLRTFAALAVLLAERPTDLDDWLRTRRPASRTELLSTTLTDALPTDTTKTPPGNAPTYAGPPNKANANGAPPHTAGDPHPTGALARSATDNTPDTATSDTEPPNNANATGTAATGNAQSIASSTPAPAGDTTGAATASTQDLAGGTPTGDEPPSDAGTPDATANGGTAGTPTGGGPPDGAAAGNTQGFAADAPTGGGSPGDAGTPGTAANGGTAGAPTSGESAGGAAAGSAQGFAGGAPTDGNPASAEGASGVAAGSPERFAGGAATGGVPAVAGGASDAAMGSAQGFTGGAPTGGASVADAAAGDAPTSGGSAGGVAAGSAEGSTGGAPTGGAPVAGSVAGAAAGSVQGPAGGELAGGGSSGGAGAADAAAGGAPTSGGSPAAAGEPGAAAGGGAEGFMGDGPSAAAGTAGEAEGFAGRAHMGGGSPGDAGAAAGGVPIGGSAGGGAGRFVGGVFPEGEADAVARDVSVGGAFAGSGAPPEVGPGAKGGASLGGFSGVAVGRAAPSGGVGPPKQFGAARPAGGVTGLPAPDDRIRVGVGLRTGKPVEIDPALLTRHTVVFAGSGSGKTVLIRRLVEECALRGVSAIVLDPNNDLARLGDPWPAPPGGWSDDDAARADAYFRHTDVVVWTPGRAGGRPLSFQPLPDLVAVRDDPDEFNSALDIAVEALTPRAAILGSVRRLPLGQAVLREALRHFAHRGGGDLSAYIGLLADLPPDASRIDGADRLAADMGQALTAAMINDPLFGGSGESADPAALLTPADGKRARVSIISLAGLNDVRGFVNRLQMALFAEIKRNPARDRPLRALYVMDEAQTLVPAIGRTAATASTLMLASQARKYGLGLVFATQAPKGLHNQIAGNATTQFFGKLNSPNHIGVVKELARMRGGNADRVARLDVGEFYVSTEALPPTLARAPLCLTHHPGGPLTDEEVIHRARTGRPER
ncbi:helicase HerA domain-containing protein [Actinomadura flavalba]|uniref:helicase HerA domain-containing protein n=1 Tax=Actinomadura flavalba TaxID=1120938 RepID=UPI00035F8072|nr:DUF87 domain-containing protein [Actinomadura flavalba]